MVLESIKNSRRAKFVQRGSHEVANRLPQAASRLGTAQTREQAASRLVTGGDKSKGKHVAKKCKDDHGDNSDFMLIHFPRLLLRKRFLENFKPRSIVTVCLEGLENILKVREAENDTDIDIGDVNQYAQLVEEAEGLEKIENLQS
ncbi:hypothetical protein WN943_007361 [Citrus x changshan-huyou]